MSYRSSPAFAIGVLDLEPSVDRAAKLLDRLNFKIEGDRDLALRWGLLPGRRVAIEPAQLLTDEDPVNMCFRVRTIQKFKLLGPGERAPTGWSVIE